MLIDDDRQQVGGALMGEIGLVEHVANVTFHDFLLGGQPIGERTPFAEQLSFHMGFFCKLVGFYITSVIRFTVQKYK